MPFGKNKKLSGPRPKKKKFVRVEEEPEEVPSIEEDANGAEEHVAENDKENMGSSGSGARQACVGPDSPGKLQRAEAEADWRFALEAAAKSARQLMEAESEHRMRARLRAAKMKRWDAAERRKEKPSAVLQLERAYKMQIDAIEAAAKVTAARCELEAADGAAFACELNVKTLEINRLRRELRMYRKNSGCRARAR